MKSEGNVVCPVRPENRIIIQLFRAIRVQFLITMINYYTTRFTHQTCKYHGYYLM